MGFHRQSTPLVRLGSKGKVVFGIAHHGSRGACWHGEAGCVVLGFTSTAATVKSFVTRSSFEQKSYGHFEARSISAEETCGWLPGRCTTKVSIL